MLPNALGNEYLILWDLLEKIVISDNLVDSISQINDANQILVRHHFEAIPISKNEIYLSDEKFQLTGIINYILNKVWRIRNRATNNVESSDRSHKSGMLEDFEYIILRIGSSGQSPKSKLNDEDIKEFLTTYFVNDITLMMDKYPDQSRAILITMMKLGLSKSTDENEYNIVSASTYTSTIFQLFSIYKKLLDESFINRLRESLSMQATG